jgi:hypothetical protein
MLQPMRRFHIWLLIAVLWALIALFSFLRHDWKQASLQAVIVLIFLAASLYTRRREQLR